MMVGKMVESAAGNEEERMEGSAVGSVVGRRVESAAGSVAGKTAGNAVGRKVGRRVESMVWKLHNQLLPLQALPLLRFLSET